MRLLAVRCGGWGRDNEMRKLARCSDALGGPIGALGSVSGLEKSVAAY